MSSYSREVYSIGVSNDFAAIPQNLFDAIREYRWLLDRGYPDQPSIKLVGDRRRLTREQRGILYRGVFSAADSSRRAGRRVSPPTSDCVAAPAADLLIDGHNVLFTIHNYLMGRPVVLATDGLSETGIGVIDPAGAVHGAAKASRAFEIELRALEIARRVGDAALEAHRANRAGDNIASAAIWLGR